MATSTYASCAYARLQLRAVYALLAKYEREFSAVSGYSRKRGLPSKRVKLDKPGSKELLFWAGLTAEDASTTLVAPQRVQTLWTDASLERWGAVLGDSHVTGDFPEALQHASIGVKELYAIVAAGQHFGEQLRNCHVELFCDN